MKINGFLLSVIFILSTFFTTSGQTFERNKANNLVSGSKLVRQDEKTKRVKYIRLNDNYFYSSTSQDEWLHKSLKGSKNHSFNKFKSETDKMGFTNSRFQVYYKNIPVEGSVYIVHSNKGRIYSANGDYFSGSDISVIPQLTEHEAYNKAIGFVNAKTYNWDSETAARPVGQLIILPVDSIYILTYKFDIYTSEPLSRQFIFVNANTGSIVKTIDRIHIADAAGTAKTMYNGSVSITTDSYNGYYRLRETGRGNGIETYNLNNGTSYANATDFTDTDNNWTDTLNYNHAANDAHFATEATYDYFYTNFNRNSYDNNGSVIKSYVHYGVGFANAFWDGASMTYGDGDGINYLPLTPIEVVSHEITHGVTEHSANLVYSYESGALNESFSDIFGIVIDFLKNPETANYLMGDAMSPTHTPFRSMQSPNDYGDPDTYLGQYWVSGSIDNGGVHTNSGVQNYWFYLLSEGGSGTNDNGNSYTVTGIGRENAAKIAYRNLTEYLTPNSNYADARFYSIQAAIDLFGDCSAEVITVTNAWYAVGVGDDYNNSVIAGYGVSKFTACDVPASISFYNHSRKASSFIWDFGDGTTDTTQNPIHIYTSAGTYIAKLIATGTALCNNSDTIWDTISISDNISPVSPTCTPVSLHSGSGGIYQFRFNSINNNTNGSGDNYKDYTCTDTTEVIEGRKYAISVKVGNITPENVYLWVDLNNNGSFADTGELLLQKFKVSKSFSDSLIIPGGATYNTPLRLRVSSDYSTYPMADACSDSRYGQIQDYTIYVEQNISVPEVKFTVNKKNIVSGDTIQFKDQSLNLPTSWNWNFPGGTPSSSTLPNPRVTYDTPGKYNVELVAANSYGSDTLVMDSMIIVTTPAPVGLSARMKNQITGEAELKWYLPLEGNVYEDFEDGVADNFIFSDDTLFNVENGYLKVAGAGDNLWKSTHYDMNFQDFVLEYKFRKEITTSNFSIGTFIRASGFLDKISSSGYLINVMPTGEYSAWKLSNGLSTNMITWKSTSAINTTIGAWNVVTIEAISDTIKIYINGLYIDEFVDSDYDSGKINLSSYFGSSYNHDVRWDYMNILIGDNISSSIKSLNLPKATNTLIPGNGDIAVSPQANVVQGNTEAKSLVEILKNNIKNTFKYYKVYRDSVFKDSTINNTYVDTLSVYGTYKYFVTSLYDDGESNPTNTVNLEWSEPNPGENCSNAQNLSNLVSPYTGSTVGYNSDFSLCGYGSSPDRIFHIDVPSGYIIKMGLTYTNFSPQYSIRVGKSCPGDSVIVCTTSSLPQMYSFKNNTDSTRRVFFEMGGYSNYSGIFTLEWDLDGPAVPQSNFSASQTYIPLGTVVNFTDLTKGIPTSWKWSFPGGNPSSSNLQNPTVTYNTLGAYDVELITTNSLGTDTIIQPEYITVSNLIYCTSNLGGRGLCPGDITNVSITGSTLNNSDHNNCSTFNNSTYGSYPAIGNKTAILKGDTIYELSVTTNSSDIISVWIDFNQNGVFEPTEWTQVAIYSNPGIPSKVNISIPGSALTGKTGMRIRSRAYSNQNGSGDACTHFGSGITEDYYVTIAQVPRVPVVNFSAKRSLVVGESVSFTDLTTGVPTSWKWYFTGATPSVSTIKNPSVTYNSAGTYNVKLVVANSLGADSITKSGYITVTVGLPGEDCVSPQNLADLSSPYSGTTTGYRSDFNFCGIYSPDRMFYIDVPDGSSLTIGQTWNNFDSRHTLRIGNTCPGTTEITCVDEPDNQMYTYKNTSGSTQRAYYIIAGYSSYYGDFTISWQLQAPSVPVADFTASSTSIVRGNYVDFTDLTTGLPTSWKWTFQGGSPVSSTSQNPYVYYNLPGVYNVTLIAVNSLGSDTILKTGYITVTLPPKPVADFYSSSTSVIKGNHTYFYDNSTNYPTSWKWTFSGGTPSTSTYRYPSVTYDTAGIYDVKLVVVNDGGADSITKVGYINVIIPPKPVANFSSGATNIIVGKYVSFYDYSTNNPTVRKWLFTGGTPSTSTSTSPYVYYNTPGTFDVKLVVSNAGGSDSIIKVGYITVTIPPKPVANFSSNITNVIAGSYVHFTDYSSNNPTSRIWTFTGGSPVTSTYSNPSVSYSTPGTYAVKLVVSNAGGSDSLTRTGYITVLHPSKPVANFYSSYTSVTAGSYTYFYDISSNTPTSWNWSFEGGTPSTSTYSNPSVTYNTPGSYNVKLVVTNGGGSDTLLRNSYITVNPPPKPVANFSSSSTVGSPGSYIYFYDNSTNSPTTRKWIFTGGTPSSSTSSSPYVYYSNYGSYDVKLVVTNAGGSDSIVKAGYITITRYCTSGLGGGGCPGDISAVSFTGTTLNNTNHNNCTSSNSSIYASYPASGNTTTSLEVGNTYELAVTTTKSDIVSVWIDYNQNGYFESSEWRQVATSTTSGIPGKVNITIPANAVKGVTAMRIRSRSSGNTNGSGDACSSFGSGITEDYTVTIFDSSKDFIADTTIICKNGTVNFSNHSTAQINTFSWYFGSGASPVTANTAGPHAVTYSTSGSKTVSLVMNGNDSIVKTGYITVLPLPATPVVYQNQNLLISNVSQGNQWYSATLGTLPGENFSTYSPLANGKYYTIVTNSGCSSLPSNTVNFVMTSVDGSPSVSFPEVFPNPCAGILNVKSGNGIIVEYLEVRSIIGELIAKVKIVNSSEGTYTLNMADYNNGLYSVSVITNKGNYTFKILKVN